MKRLTIALGALAVTATLPLIIPSTAYGATGTFTYHDLGDNRQEVIKDPANRCYTTLGAKGPIDNKTDVHAIVYSEPSCQGGTLGTLTPGAHDDNPRPFRSVRFI